MSVISIFVAGADALGYLVAALLFFRARLRSQQFLFAALSGAFGLLAVSEFLFIMERAKGEGSAPSDLLRLVAFALALGAMGYRNLEEQH
jgi:Family of unknown function (DUF5985)